MISFMPPYGESNSDNLVALRKYFRLQSLPGDGIPPNNRRVDRLMMPTSSWVQEVVGRP